MTCPYDEENFWSRVDTSVPSACWEWQTATDRDGYGRYYEAGSRYRAHRIAHEIETGERPPVVRHTCDNPGCCNPAHLKGGTQADNIADKLRRDRQAKGSSNGRSKLCEAEVRQIKRELREKKVVQAQVARDYGVSKWAIRDIAHGKTWTHVSVD